MACQSELVECQSEPVEDHLVINSSILPSLTAEIYFLARLFSLFHRPKGLQLFFMANSPVCLNLPGISPGHLQNKWQFPPNYRLPRREIPHNPRVH